MRQRCSSCGTPNPEEARYCMSCGTALQPGLAPGSSGRAGPALDPDRKRARGSRVTGLVLGLSILLAAGGLIPFLLLDSKGCSSAEGSLSLSGPPWGDHTITPVACRSGQHMQFFGLALFSDAEANPDLVVVKDAVRGDTVKIQTQAPACNPSCPPVLLAPSQCETFDVAVDTTNTTVNDIRLLDGHLNLDCTLPSGARATGQIRFESCD